jgi:hypothetical protein
MDAAGRSADEILHARPVAHSVSYDCRALTPLSALGAGEGNRTPDLLITSEPLCRLSYPGVVRADCSAAPTRSSGASTSAFSSEKLSPRVDFSHNLRWAERRLRLRRGSGA